MRFIPRAIVVAALILMVLVTSIWACLALWYRLPAADLSRAIGAGLFGLLALVTLIMLFGRCRLKAFAA